MLLLVGCVTALAAEHVADGGLREYRCNTHTHTKVLSVSDVNAPPDVVARWYRDHGYQCLFITDHEHLTDVVSINKEFVTDANFLVIRGQEITQVIEDPSRPAGLRHHHINGLDIHRRIDPVGYPKPAKDVTPLEAYARNMAEIRAAGGLPQINHPNLEWSVAVGDIPQGTQPFLLEVWNAAPASNNLGGGDANGNSSPAPEGLWDMLLTRGQIVWAVASDDAHEYQRFDDHRTSTPGKAWIVVRAESLTAPAVMQTLREGRFYASTGITLESYSMDRRSILLTISPKSTWTSARKPNARFKTRFIGAGGKVLLEANGPAPRYDIKGDEGYVRASIIDSDGMRAWTQPVFLDARQGRAPTLLIHFPAPIALQH